MNLSTLAQKYNTQSKCVKYLEKVRWNGKPKCPYCEESRVSKRIKMPFRIQKYHCNKCNRDFTVISQTIFEASKLPLPKWFQLIHLMLTSPKGIASMQLSRMLGITYKTAWYCAMRVRCAMVDDEIDLLEGIVEMDESYLGGRPRKRNQIGQNTDNAAILSDMEDSPKKIKRGRGTKKVPVVGIVERDGGKRVRLEVMDKLTGKNLLAMLKRYVNTEKAIAVTDEYPAYAKFEEELQHLVVKHKEYFFADGDLHTNTIENVWSIIKNGLRGQYQALSKKYLPFYLAEWAYKYNRRDERPAMFAETIEKAVTEEKPMLDYKPTKPVAEITTGDAFRKAAERQAAAKQAERAARSRKPKLRAAAHKKNKPKRVKKKGTVPKKSAKRIVRSRPNPQKKTAKKLVKRSQKVFKPKARAKTKKPVKRKAKARRK